MNQKRTIDQIIHAPEAHWVGTGFRVKQYFPNGDTSPLLERMSPFILLDYNEPYYFEGSPFESGVSPHPHKGFETVTFSFAGSIEHKDTAGNHGIIHSGDVQWMTAAGGVLHKEYHEKEYAKRGRMFHAIQLWVNLPKAHKQDAPTYQTLRKQQMGLYTSLDETIKGIVYAGTFRNIIGPARTHTPMNIYKLSIDAGSYISISEQPHWNTGFLVLAGSGTVNGESTESSKNGTPQMSNSIQAGDFVIMNNNADRFEIDAGPKGMEIFVLSGEPIDEPIAKRGPFVMNDGVETLLATSEWQNGRFGLAEDIM